MTVLIFARPIHTPFVCVPLQPLVSVYHSQVLQMSVPVDEDGSYHDSPFGLKSADDVAYISSRGLAGSLYERESPTEGAPSSIGNASTARVGSCVSAFDDSVNGGPTKNPLYIGYK